MSDGRRTIQIRINEYESSKKQSNEGFALVTRVQKNDRVWFLYYSKNGDAPLEARFTESPFKDGQKIIPLEKITAAAHDGDGAGKGVQITAPARDKPYYYEIHSLGESTQLITGQIDIDP
jgi:hypothetical protein